MTHIYIGNMRKHVGVSKQVANIYLDEMVAKIFGHAFIFLKSHMDL
jgi:hypothetical protein